MIETTENQTSETQRSAWGWPLVLAITLVLSPAVGTLGGLAASQPTGPVDAEQPQWDPKSLAPDAGVPERPVHDAVCTLVPAKIVSDNCAEWVAQREIQAENANSLCEIDEACTADIETGPNGDRVYTVAKDVKASADETEWFAPDGQSIGLIEARDATSGDLAWSATLDLPTGSDFLTEVAVSPEGDQVYVAGSSWAYEGADPEQPSWDAVTAAYDAETGEQLWIDVFGSSAWPGSLQGTLDNAEKLVVGPEGKVYTMVNAGNVNDPRAAPLPDAAVVAYEPDTGQRAWTHLFEGKLCSLSGSADVTLPGTCWADMDISPDGDHLALAGRMDTRIVNQTQILFYQAVLLSTADGEIDWTREFASELHNFKAAVAIDEERVYVQTVGTILQAFNVDDGVHAWSAQNAEPPGTARHVGLAVDSAADKLFTYSHIEAIGDPIVLRAYDAQDGSVIWEQDADPNGDVRISLSPDGGTLVQLRTGGVGQSHGLELEALNTTTGEPEWSTSYREEPSSRGPLYYAGGVAVGPLSETVHAFGIVDRDPHEVPGHQNYFTTFVSEIGGPTFDPGVGT